MKLSDSGRIDRLEGQFEEFRDQFAASCENVARFMEATNETLTKIADVAGLTERSENEMTLHGFDGRRLAREILPADATPESIDKAVVNFRMSAPQPAAFILFRFGSLVQLHFIAHPDAIPAVFAASPDPPTDAGGS